MCLKVTMNTFEGLFFLMIEFWLSWWKPSWIVPIVTNCITGIIPISCLGLFANTFWVKDPGIGSSQGDGNIYPVRNIMNNFKTEWKALALKKTL